MNSFFKRIAPLFLALLMTMSVFTPVYAADGADEPQVFYSPEDLVLAASEATSLQYAVVRGDTVVKSGSSGVYSRTENTPLTADNLYGIGSVSKVYTTAAVMLLVDRGLIELDKPVTAYIPDFFMADPRYRDITVRMLLNHSSGLYGSSTSNAFLFNDKSQEAKDTLLEQLRTQQLKAKPGAFSVYCNDGFTLAEILVERVSGVSFTDFLQSEILSKIGLSSTFTPQSSFNTQRLAKTYFENSVRDLPVETVGVIGTGGIYASATDMARFGSVYYTDRVLSVQSRNATMVAEYKKGDWIKDDDSSISFGLGWDNVSLYPFKQNGIQALCKGGDTLNYHGSLVVLPEYNMSAAVLSSGGSSMFDQMLAVKLLVDELQSMGMELDLSVDIFTDATPAEVPESEMQRSGLYGSNMLLTNVDITSEGMTLDVLPGVSLTYYSDGSYRFGDQMLFYFEDANGKSRLIQKATVEIPDFPALLVCDYVGEKLPARNVHSSVVAAWQEQVGKMFFIVSEKASSQVYLSQPGFGMTFSDVSGNYISGKMIANEKRAMSFSMLPGTGGRDWQDIEMIVSGDVMYMNAGGYLAISQDNVADIAAGTNAVCTIQPEGHARWYFVGDSAGKSMSVTVPEGGVYYVYNSFGLVVETSLYSNDLVTLPQGGFMTFVGAAGDRFEITIQ